MGLATTARRAGTPRAQRRLVSVRSVPEAAHSPSAHSARDATVIPGQRTAQQALCFSASARGPAGAPR